MKTVKYDVEYSESADRVELFFRIVWLIPTYFVMLVLGILVEVAWFLQFLCILFTGKRNRMLFDLSKKYMLYTTQLSTYLFLLTDERNPLMPED
jgi:hypothetical protein